MSSDFKDFDEAPEEAKVEIIIELLEKVHQQENCLPEHAVDLYSLNEDESSAETLYFLGLASDEEGEEPEPVTPSMTGSAMYAYLLGRLDAGDYFCQVILAMAEQVEINGEVLPTTKVIH